VVFSAYSADHHDITELLLKVELNNKTNIIISSHQIERTETFKNRQIYDMTSAEYAEKTTDLSQVTDKLYHIVLSRVSLVIAGFELTTLVLIGNDSISSFLQTDIPHDTNVEFSKHSRGQANLFNNRNKNKTG
jgi:hypothetical protein